ncbi:hypothetical protein PAL_GLEAN10013867 [Pteropus alecto]|uniref:Uncharacterized protein n=1 Tax=Pteropus alecto TaxID=9402 RepID=L5K7V1_PTEAL|nr:hypothetical protein PAL_GLEAN10013867 [Pteropus alecto]
MTELRSENTITVTLRFRGQRKRGINSAAVISVDYGQNQETSSRGAAAASLHVAVPASVTAAPTPPAARRLGRSHRNGDPEPALAQPRLSTASFRDCPQQSLSRRPAYGRPPDRCHWVTHSTFQLLHGTCTCTRTHTLRAAAAAASSPAPVFRLSPF